MKQLIKQLWVDSLLQNNNRDTKQLQKNPQKDKTTTKGQEET